MSLTLRHQDRRYVVTTGRRSGTDVGVEIDGRALTVEALLVDACTLQLRLDGRLCTAFIVRAGHGYDVHLDGVVYRLTLEEADTGSAATLATPRVVAPMPGKVLKVLVSSGQSVAAGDGLVILEAMKMETRLVAEAAATVERVHVQEGQMVDAGDLLIELAALQPSAAS
jgi:acetyl/propionyl-CoA carboxylase alpha subunit